MFEGRVCIFSVFAFLFSLKKEKRIEIKPVFEADLFLTFFSYLENMPQPENPLIIPFIIGLLLVSFFYCSKPIADKYIDVDRGIIMLPQDSIMIPEFFHPLPTWTVSPEDISIVEQLLEKHTEKKDNLSKPLEQYTRQYVGIVHEGRKKVYLNAFCDDLNQLDAWKTNLLWVLDGGDCYFQVVIDLEKKKVLRFSVNGES